MTTIDLTDELLCAYLDGELDGETRARVDRSLEQDPGARVRLDRLRTADAWLRRAVPESSSNFADPLAERILSEKSFARRRLDRLTPFVPVALAAGIAGIVIGISMTTSNLGTSLDFAGKAPSNGIANALDSLQSGATTKVGDGDVRMVLSFRSSDGRYCRVFATTQAKQSAEGLACREEAGWQVVAWDGTSVRADGFRPAGSHALMDSTMERIGGTVSISLDQERQLIDKRWRR